MSVPLVRTDVTFYGLVTLKNNGQEFVITSMIGDIERSFFR